MRFTRFLKNGKDGLAVWAGGEWRGAVEGDAFYPGTLEKLVGSASKLAQAHDAIKEQGGLIDIDNIEYRPLLSDVRKIICVGLNYKDHSAESGFKQPDYPTLFFRVGTSLTAHRQPIERPTFSDTLDFEGELAAVIGKTGKNIGRNDALSYVAGYSIFNDATIREYQFKTPQWTVGKNFDRTGAIGPWFVTPDEFPDGGKGKTLETRLNGKVMQSASIDDMVFDLPSLIETISVAITLEPGDIIVTGTPSGVGHARSPRLYMQPGDVCEIEIDGLGVLVNSIVAQR